MNRKCELKNYDYEVEEMKKFELLLMHITVYLAI